MNASQRQVSLTGIQATGEPHLGNYIGAIRPALELAGKYESMYFIADYHGLTSLRDPRLIGQYTRSVAATWLAAGLDPGQTIFYRQSDIPEVFELTWVLSCVTAKGLANRAHAYKAARDRNAEAGAADLDAGINMGLYCYPLLMAADILIMESDVVPVGKDQLQHVEYAADIAGSFNHLYGAGYTFKIPKAVTPSAETGETLPGLDGRKMSKSYGNTIPLFASSAEQKKLIRRIKTESTPVEEPKDPGSSIVFQLYEQFAPPGDVSDMRQRLEAGGTGWGTLKDALHAELDRQFAPMRARYEELMSPDSNLDTLLAEGAARARERAIPVVKAVRRAVGV